MFYIIWSIKIVKKKKRPENVRYFGHVQYNTNRDIFLSLLRFDPGSSDTIVQHSRVNQLALYNQHYHISSGQHISISGTQRNTVSCVHEIISFRSQHYILSLRYFLIGLRWKSEGRQKIVCPRYESLTLYNFDFKLEKLPDIRDKKKDIMQDLKQDWKPSRWLWW